MSIYLTKKELASITGYTYRRLHDIDMGLPDDGKLFVEGEGKKCDLAIFVQRWVKYKTDQATGDGETLDDVKAVHERVKTEKTQIEVAKLKGQLVDVMEIRRLWASIAKVVMQTMLRLPSKIAPLLVMQDNTELIAGIIDRELRDALNDIANTPLPDAAASTSEEDDGED